MRTGKRRKTLSDNGHRDQYLMDHLLSVESQVLCCALLMHFFI